MKFTGIDLERVLKGLALHLSELKIQAINSPRSSYALELEVDQVGYLLTHVERNIELEKEALEKISKPLTPNQYIGKVCLKHPELKGLRGRPSYRCVKCMSNYQTQRMRLKRAAEKASK